MIPNATRLGDMPKGDPLPEGTYYLRCDKAELKHSGPNAKNPNAPMASTQWTVFGPAEAEEFHGRKVFENFMLSGEGMFRTRQALEAGGFGEDDLLEDTDQFKNLEVAAVVGVEKEGKGADGKVYPARNVVKRYLPIA